MCGEGGAARRRGEGVESEGADSRVSASFILYDRSVIRAIRLEMDG